MKSQQAGSLLGSALIMILFGPIFLVILLVSMLVKVGEEQTTRVIVKADKTLTRGIGEPYVAAKTRTATTMRFLFQLVVGVGIIVLLLALALSKPHWNSTH